jgi:hypothetical protein
MQIDLGRDLERLRQVRLAARLQGPHRVVEHVGIQVEAHFLHLA